MIGKRIDQQGKSNSCLFVICVFSLKQHNRFKTAFALAGGPAFNTQFNSDTSNTTRSHNTTTTNTTTHDTFNLSINDNTSIVKGLQVRNLETSLNDKLAASGRTVAPGDLYAVTVRRGKYQDGVPYQAGQEILPAGDGSVTHILEAFGVSAGGETINFKRVTDKALRKMERGAAEGENAAEVAGAGEGGYNSIDTNIEDDNVYLEISQFTKKLLATKPLNSPNPKKWYENGGEISISNGVWCYRDSMNHVVSYPNGYPDFAKARLVIDEVKLLEFRNYSTDFRSADKSCGKELLDNETWHHHEDLTTMQKMDSEIHEVFTHRGGMSLRKRTKE